jgi:5-methylcytosine-specific restriction protein B
LAQGIGSGGQGYNTRRPFEIAFLIEFAIAWKRLPDADRSAAVSDPWKFMEIVDGIDGADARQGRHMLLHILFPDSFERIASREHKRRVVASFSSVLDGEGPEDTDRKLLAIRERLAGMLGRKDLDFYWSPSSRFGTTPVRAARGLPRWTPSATSGRWFSTVHPARAKPIGPRRSPTA